MEDSRRRSKELPEECWELILSRLAIDDDFQSPSLVCKQFLSITNRLRRELVADKKVFFRNRCEVLCRAIQRFRNLKDIELSEDVELSDDEEEVDDGDVNCAVSKIVSSGLDLQALSFSCLEIPPSAESFSRLGSTMNNLKTLRCDEFRRLRDLDLVPIADALPRLEELDITYPRNDFYSRGVIYPPELSYSMVTDAGIELISRKLPRLRKIDISGIRVCSDRSLIALSSNCVLLNEIRCHNCDITQHGIFFVLCRSPNLISLRAGDCRSSPRSSLTFDDLKIYARSLGSSLAFDDLKIYARSLRVLDICACEDQDRLLCSIAEAGIPLEKLIIQDDYGLSFHGLSTLLCACPSLKRLELAHISYLNDDSMRELCRFLPNAVTIKLIYCSNLTIATFFMLAKTCPALSKSTLKTSNLEVHDDFVMDVERNHRMTSVDLSTNVSLNDELLKKVGLSCPNLHTLDVRECDQLTKEGIGEIFKCCSQLKHLAVSKCMEIHLETFNTRQINIGYF